MKIVSFITAALACVFLYFLVVEREALLAFANVDQSSDETSGASDTEESNLINVLAIHSTARTVDTAVVLRGRTEADRQVEVRAETSGQIISEPLRKGRTIEAGDILCQIDPGTRPATLAEAEARLAQARAGIPEAESLATEAQARVTEARINLTAAQKLSEGGFASDTRLASAQAAYDAALAGIERTKSAMVSAEAAIQSAEAAVANAKRELERVTISAPFGGLLETDTAELGALLTPSGLCGTIIALAPIKIVAFVPETEVEKITVGAAAGARLASGPEISGRVTFLSRSADPATRTFRVELEAANPDLAIRDGQTAEILIASAGRPAHLVPQSALTLDDSGRLGLRVLEGENVVGFAPVEVLRDTAEGVWVSGLPDTANIIVLGQEYVTNGVQVAPSFREVAQ